MAYVRTALPFGYCVICGDPAALIYHGTQVCGMVCFKKWRSGMKTKAVCPHCGKDCYRDGAWWACKCGYKGVYPDRVEVKENDETKV